MWIGGIQGTTVREKAEVGSLMLLSPIFGAKKWALSACQAESQWGNKKKGVMAWMQYGNAHCWGGRRVLTAQQWEDAMSERVYDSTE